MPKIHFKNLNKTIEFDPSRAPFGHDGRPGSILDVALAHDVDVEHACGGSCACTTCHVIVSEGMNNLSKIEEEEEDRLDLAEGLTLHSRLACQAIVHGDVTVEFPKHHRNMPPGASQ